MTTRVWIAHKKNHDTYGKALKYGDEIKTYAEGSVNVFRLSELVKGIRKRFNEESHFTDRLIVGGYPIINAILIHLYLTTYGEVNLLFWNAKRQDYTEHRLLDSEFYDVENK